MTVYAWGDASTLEPQNVRPGEPMAAAGALVWPESGEDPVYHSWVLTSTNTTLSELAALVYAVELALPFAGKDEPIVVHTDCDSVGQAVNRQLFGRDLTIEEEETVRLYRRLPPRPVPVEVARTVAIPDCKRARRGDERTHHVTNELLLPELGRLCTVAVGRLLVVARDPRSRQLDLCDALARRELGCATRTNVSQHIDDLIAEVVRRAELDRRDVAFERVLRYSRSREPALKAPLLAGLATKLGDLPDRGGGDGGKAS